MIAITAELRCDGCHRTFRSRVGRWTEAAPRDRLDGLRAEAARKGWARYRSGARAPMGDYCPTCQRARQRARKGAPT